MIITEVDELVAGPVSRVIIRDPAASADDFVELAARLGLHGTDYVVGWTAWLDLSAGRRLQGVRAGDRGRQARRRPGRRAGHRRRPQRHRDAPVGRPRRGHGPVDRGGPRRPPTPSPTASTTTGPRPSSSALVPRDVSLPRLVATDLDGTLVRSDGTVSQYTHDVIAELDDRGVPVVFVTGRPLRWAEERLPVRRRARPGDRLQRGAGLGRGPQRGRPGPRDPGRRRARGLPADPGGRAGATFAVETLAGIALESVVPGTAPGPRRQSPGELDDVFDAPALKILARHEELPPRSSGTSRSPRWATAR